MSWSEPRRDEPLRPRDFLPIAVVLSLVAVIYLARFTSLVPVWAAVGATVAAWCLVSVLYIAREADRQRERAAVDRVRRVQGYGRR